MGLANNSFGKTTDGRETTIYTMENSKGMKVSCIDYGAIITNIYVPDSKGELADVVLGFDDVSGYEINSPFFGAFIGRHANRIGGASFTLNDITYELEKNNGANNLHGGTPGYHKVMYKASADDDDNQVTFTRTSPDMEQGYPGKLVLSVTYKLTENNELLIKYDAMSDKDTIVNFTNHSYFNLDGEGSGTIENHIVMLNADSFTPTGSDLIPTGKIVSVKGTPLDFTEPKRVGDEIAADYEPIKFGQGYDHNFVLNKDFGEFAQIGIVEGTSGRRMRIFTDLPGVQFYSGNNIGTVTNGKGGKTYTKRDGMCFETQFYPDSCNKPEFPSCVLKAGSRFYSETMYRFE